VLRKKIPFFLLVCALLLFIIGVKSEIYLGDEAYHYTFAKGIYEARERVASNPIYAAYPKLEYFYFDVPLWHGLLAGLWWVIGSPSKILAQGYQVFYFILLVVSSYFLGRSLYGEKAGMMGMIIALSLPLVAAFSIILYLDVPVAAWAIFSLGMLYRKKWFYTGIGVGAMLLTKINGFLLLPGFAILLFLHSQPRWIDKLRAFLFVSLPAVMINLPELYFRKTHFGYIYYIAPKYIPKEGPPGAFIFEPSSLYIQPWNLIIYFGIVIWIGIFLYFGKKLYEHKDLLLWIPIGTYLIIFPIFFHYSFPLRNLSPMLAPLALLGGKGLASIRSKKLKYFILGICLLQFLAVSGKVYLKRQIPVGIKEAYAYIQNHSSLKAVFLYPEENLVLYTNRPIVWSHIVEMPKLFWQADGEEIRSILKKYEVSYIAIKRDRIFDEPSIRHTGGYPQSFIEKLPKQTFLRLVFNNPEVSIWQVGS
jgi:4-amino-4-deoxy-L-arabinose transferase-like glycosyltransferase